MVASLIDEAEIKKAAVAAVHMREAVIILLMLERGASIKDLVLQRSQSIPGRPLVERLLWRNELVATFIEEFDGTVWKIETIYAPGFEPQGSAHEENQ